MVITPMHRRCGGVGAILLGFAAIAAAQSSEPNSSYAERFTFDPATGEFKAHAAPQSGTEQGDLELARRALAQQRPKAARKRLRTWGKTYGASSDRAAEALFLRGEAEFAAGNYMKAHALFRELTDSYPSSAFTDRAVQRDFVIAETFLAGTKRKFLGMRMLSATEEALDILDEIATSRPGSDLAGQALRTRATYFHRTGDFESAAIEFDRLARDFPRHRFARMALLRSGQASVASFPGVAFDASALREAEAKFKDLKTLNPRFAEQQDVDGLVEQIETSRAEKAYHVATFYERVRQPEAASRYYQSIVRRWPGTSWGQRARQRLDVMGYLAGEAPLPAASVPNPPPVEPRADTP